MNSPNEPPDPRKAMTELFDPETLNNIFGIKIEEDVQEGEDSKSYTFCIDKEGIVKTPPGGGLGGDEIKRNVLFRVIYFCGRKIRRSLSGGWNTLRRFGEVTLFVFGVGLTMFVITAFIQYLFTVSPVVAWAAIVGLSVQLIATTVAYVSRTWVEYSKAQRIKRALA